MFNSKWIQCFRSVSNQGPFACEANVITTTQREHKIYCELTYFQNLATQQRQPDNCPAFKFITFSRTYFGGVLCDTLYYTYLIINIHYLYIYSLFSQESALERSLTLNISKERGCFRPVPNQGPFTCEANVITTTLRKLVTHPNLATQKQFINCPVYKFTTFDGTSFRVVVCEWK